MKPSEKKDHLLPEENNTSFKNSLRKVGQALKSEAALATGTLAIFLALNFATPQEASSQTLMNNNDYWLMIKNAKLSQENIGEDMSKFIFGGGIERRLQLEIARQNSKHGEKYDGEDFSMFKDESVKGADERKEPILDKVTMERHLKTIVDSMTTNDVAAFYLAFQNYEKSGVKLVGNKKWKGKLPAGWNLAGFPVDMNIDFLIKNNALPYAKDDQVKLKKALETIYETELSNRKKVALENRKSMDKATYESADLLALEQARENIVARLYKAYIQPIIDKMFNQFYSTGNDAKGWTSKKSK